MANRFIEIPARESYAENLDTKPATPFQRFKPKKLTPAENLERWKIQAVAARSGHQRTEQADSWLKEVANKELEQETEARRIAEARYRERRLRYFQEHGSFEQREVEKP